MWKLYPTKKERNKEAKRQAKCDPQKKINIARAAVKDIVLTLQDANFQGQVGIETSEVFEGGSLGQGTSVPNHYDLDLVLYSRALKPESAIRDDGYPEFLERIDSYLGSHLDNYTKIKTTKIAISFKYTPPGAQELEFDLLLSPYWENKESYFEAIRKIPSAPDRLLFSVTTSRWQTDYVRHQDQHVKELIKRAKAWRNNTFADSQDGKIKSYPLSLLVIAAYHKVPADKRKRRLVKYADSVTGELKRLIKAISENPQIDIEIPGRKYEELRHTFPDLLPPVPRIVDPVNPTNNIYLSAIASTKDTREYKLRWDILASKIDSIDLKKDWRVIIKEGIAQ